MFSKLQRPNLVGRCGSDLLKYFDLFSNGAINIIILCGECKNLTKEDGLLKQITVIRIFIFSAPRVPTPRHLFIGPY